MIQHDSNGLFAWGVSLSLPSNYQVLASFDQDRLIMVRAILLSVNPWN